MEFKGRFFSSKKSDTSSPDGSYNSPKSSGSNSPARSDKKKGKSTSKDNSPTSFTSSFKDKKKKEIKVKESQSLTPNLGNPSEVEVKKEVIAPTNVPLSPIMASSLGLYKIKTGSGPLPQESFFGYGSREKGNNVIGVSNLSKIGGDGTSSGSGKKSLWKKDEEKNAGWVDNVSSSGAESNVSRERSSLIPGPSRLQNGQSSSGAGQSNSSWVHSGGTRGMDPYTPELKTSYDCDNPKESESPRFQAILRVTSAPRKRIPGDIKSFSHELNSKGVRPFPFWKPRGLNNLEEVLTMIRTKFDIAKEEVDSDLHIFAADLVGVLEKNAETHPEWQETIEDLLVLAWRCAITSSGEFWLQCEGIVQELDDRRQELPMGMLKQMHTRMLFILTRCTRLLQFNVP